MALQEAIDNFKTLSSQNGELIGQNTKLLDKINELAEPMQGKQWIVDAINEMGGNASIEDSLYTLGEKIEQLVVVSPDTIFTDDVPTPINLATIAVQPAIVAPYVKHLYSEEVTTPPSNIFLKMGASIETISCPNASFISQGMFYNATKLKEAHFISATSMSGTDVFNGCEKLEIVNIRQFNGTAFYARTFNLCKNLIDIVIGEGLVGSISFSQAYYNPTTSYSKATNSLCHDTDLERYGQTFATNWDKWKWCIINHFAANLLDRSGMETAFTITFGSTVLAQFDEEMIAAFTDKNWTLA